MQESDIVQAEKRYSEDQLQEIAFELRDVAAHYPDVPYAFIGANCMLTESDVGEKLMTIGVLDKDTKRLIELLLWFGFLGVIGKDGEERYAYQYQYGVGRMIRDVAQSYMFVIHPAFRPALGCEAHL